MQPHNAPRAHEANTGIGASLTTSRKDIELSGQGGEAERNKQDQPTSYTLAPSASSTIFRK
jgi:hypothetical protein